jgi:superoxide dismutase
LQISQVQLRYTLDAIEPAIDTKTMTFHYGTHYSAYVNNTNAALANVTELSNDMKSNLTGQCCKMYICSASYSKQVDPAEHVHACSMLTTASIYRYHCPDIHPSTYI